jgi:hypothetical protein
MKLAKVSRAIICRHHTSQSAGQRPVWHVASCTYHGIGSAELSSTVTACSSEGGSMHGMRAKCAPSSIMHEYFWHIDASSRSYKWWKHDVKQPLERRSSRHASASFHGHIQTHTPSLSLSLSLYLSISISNSTDQSVCAQAQKKRQLKIAHTNANKAARSRPHKRTCTHPAVCHKKNEWNISGQQTKQNWPFFFWIISKSWRCWGGVTYAWKAEMRASTYIQQYISLSQLIYI